MSARHLSYALDVFVQITGDQTFAHCTQVVLHEGRHRQIRRMLASKGMHVCRLKRVAIGPLTLGALPVGAVRELTDAEVRRLRQSAGLA
jgi:23S rRNA pseudouridine2605 synthase